MTKLWPVRQAAWLVLWCAVAAPAFQVLRLVNRRGVDVPIGDEWWISSVFGAGGPFPLMSELLRPVNEARPLFPKALFVALAQLGHWNTRWEMFVTVALLVAAMALLVFLWDRTIAVPRAVMLFAPTIPLSLVLFSPAQHDNLLWGMQLMLYVPVVALLLLLAVCTTQVNLPTLLAWAATLSFIATFSFSNGLLVWAVSVPALVRCRWGAHRRALWAWAGWAAALVGTIWLYFHDLPAGLLTARVVREMPGDALRGFLAYVGSSLSDGGHPVRLEVKFVSALWGGGIALAVLIGATAFLSMARTTAAVWDALAIWVSVAGYGVASGILAVAGRLHFGPEYLLESRYIAFSVSLLAATGALATLALSEVWKRGGFGGRAAVMLAGVVLSISMGVAALRAGANATCDIRDTYRSRLRARAVLTFFDLARPEDLRYLNYSSDTLVRERAPMLFRLGFLQDLHRLPQYRPQAPPKDVAQGCVEIASRLPDDGVRAAGWSFLTAKGRPSDAVLITSASAPQGEPSAIAVPKWARADVSAALATSDALLSGWDVVVPPIEHPFIAWAYDVERNEAYEIPRCLTAIDPE